MEGDHGIGFTDVTRLELSSEAHHFVAVGYSQGKFGFYSAAASYWIEFPTEKPYGSGVLLKYNYDGTILKAARVGFSTPLCTTSGLPYDGFVRLNAVDCFPSNSTSATEGTIIAVGSCNSYFNPNNSSYNNEQIFISCYNSDLELLWYRIVRPIEISNDEQYTGRARSVAIRDDGVIAVSGDFSYVDAVRGGHSDMFVVELDSKGQILDGSVIVKEGDCDNDGTPGANHAESIIYDNDHYALVGSTCDYFQPPLNSSGWCGTLCFGQKGDIIGVRWSCTSAITSGFTKQFGHYGTDGIVHSGGMTWSQSLSIVSTTSTVLSSLGLASHSITQPCKYVSVKEVEVVKNFVVDETTVPCPVTTDAPTHFDGGTLHGTSEIPSSCWP